MANRKVYIKKLSSSVNKDMEDRFKKLFPDAILIDKWGVRWQPHRNASPANKYYQYFRFYKKKQQLNLRITHAPKAVG